MVVSMKKLNKLIDPTYVNTLLEQYYQKGIIIELKTCQDLIESGDPAYPIRHGRFTLDKDQHDILVIKGGFYLFLVKNNGGIIKGKIVSAEDITFTKQVNWKFIMD